MSALVDFLYLLLNQNGQSGRSVDFVLHYYVGRRFQSNYFLNDCMGILICCLQKIGLGGFSKMSASVSLFYSID